MCIIDTVHLKPHMLLLPVHILLKYVKMYYVFNGSSSGKAVKRIKYVRVPPCGVWQPFT